MPKDFDGLDIEVGITLNRLSKQLAAAEARMVKTASKMERDFAKANDRSASSFRKVNMAIGRVEMSAARLGGVLAGALSVREITRYADAWTVAGNKIAAASQVTGTQARSLSELNDIADETRSGIEETVDLYAKLLRATKGVARDK